MTASDVKVTAPSRSGLTLLAVPVVVGVGVAVGLGVYGSLHEPALYGISIAGFSSGAAAKTWLTTSSCALAIVQLVTGGGMWGWCGRGVRSGVAPLRRWARRLRT